MNDCQSFYAISWKNYVSKFQKLLIWNITVYEKIKPGCSLKWETGLHVFLFFSLQILKLLELHPCPTPNVSLTSQKFWLLFNKQKTSVVWNHLCVSLFSSRFCATGFREVNICVTTDVKVNEKEKYGWIHFEAHYTLLKANILLCAQKLIQMLII